MFDPKKTSDLTESRDARIALRARAHLEEALAHLRFAHRLRDEARYSTTAVEAAINQAQDELLVAASTADRRIVKRRKPSTADSGQRFTVFIDECGNHALHSKDSFKAFSLSAIVINDADLEGLNAIWHTWKQTHLGSETKPVHAEDIRAKNRAFYFGGDAAARDAAVASLDQCVRSLPFVGFVCVIERERYVAKYGAQPLDSSLPRHPYLLTVDLLAERIALAIDVVLGGGRARWVIESRGPAEDAGFQYEFARLFLDGTAYLSPHFFRKLFKPGLEFQGKSANLPGLELADLQARPCAEKVLRPESTPARWEVFRDKLCPGHETAHSILGLKVLPWDDAYERLWESEKDHFRDPLTPAEYEPGP